MEGGGKERSGISHREWAVAGGWPRRNSCRPCTTAVTAEHISGGQHFVVLAALQIGAAQHRGGELRREPTV